MSDSLESHQHEVVCQFPNITCILRSVVSLSGEPWAPVSCSWKLEFVSDQVNPVQSSTCGNGWVAVSRVNDDLVLVEWNESLVNVVASSQGSVIQKVVVSVAHGVILDEGRDGHVGSDVLIQKNLVDTE